MDNFLAGFAAKSGYRIAAPMRPVFVNAFVDAPRERVFDLIADLSSRPAFCDHFMNPYRLQRLESTGVGAAARFRITAPRAALWAESEIVEVDAPHMLRERGRGGRLDRIPMHTVWEVLESAGTTCEVKVAFWTEPEHPLDKLREGLSSSRWYRRQLNRALERLRDLAESENPEASRVLTAGG
jgi:hypothetical protein